jgi:hypothetical protein
MVRDLVHQNRSCIVNIVIKLKLKELAAPYQARPDRPP